MHIHLDLDHLLEQITTTPDTRAGLTEAITMLPGGTAADLVQEYRQLRQRAQQVSRDYADEVRRLIGEVTVTDDPRYRNAKNLTYQGKTWRLSAPRRGGFSEVSYTMSTPTNEKVILLFKMSQQDMLPSVAAVRLMIASTKGRWRPEPNALLAVPSRLG